MPGSGLLQQARLRLNGKSADPAKQAPKPKLAMGTPKKGASGSNGSGLNLTAAKVYPSVQQRTLIFVEQIVAEALTVMETAKQSEGLKTVSLGKVQSIKGKLDDKLSSEATVNQMTAHNKIVVAPASDGNPPQEQDLRDRGMQLLDKARGLSEQLAYVEQLVKGFSCNDSLAIEGTSTFLQRAVADAVAAGIHVPPECIIEVARRHLKGRLAEGQLNCAISTIDPQVEVPCGLWSLKETQHLSEAQTSLMSVMESDIIESDTWSKEQVMEALQGMERSAQDPNLKKTMAQIKTIICPEQYTSQDVESADEYFGPRGEAPQDFKLIFLAGESKKLLLKAKRVHLQRSIDAGGGGGVSS